MKIATAAVDTRGAKVGRKAAASSEKDIEEARM